RCRWFATAIATAATCPQESGPLFLMVLLGLGILGIGVTVRSLLAGPAPSAERPVLPATLVAPLWAELGSNALARGVLARANEPLSREDAARVIQSWQDVKARALGQNHEVDALATVLTEPLLAEWQGRALELKANQQYIAYATQPIEVLDFAAEGSDGAMATVRIQESREFFQRGTADPDQSQPNADYRVRYRLARSEDRWAIADMTVLGN
ncbi:MAG: DUF4101 domain-containing protein, partial [Oscillatoriales cyanobacterium SM2_1_8]|nr:DUF4101 domain-containing protein [Oscillatoriales cyanobacterium SM2_1_8]